jgi:hypothetical protein
VKTLVTFQFLLNKIYLTCLMPSAQDMSDLPVPQQIYAEDKPKKDIVGQAVEVGRQGLIGGIVGAVFPEAAQATGRAIQKGQYLPGPVGRAA